MQDVTAAIIVQDGKVLLTRRAPGQKHAGKWEFPGGKCEAQESPVACLTRELAEEFAITSQVIDFFAESVFFYPGGTIRLLAYRTKIVAGELKLHVHDQIAWVTPADLLQYDLLPADVPIAEKLRGDTIA